MTSLALHALPVIELDPAELSPHPKNYKSHPEAQLKHLVESIRENGMYRQVVVARGDVILIGHGITEAAKRIDELPTIPVIRVDIEPDDPRALRLLIADNETSRLAGIDDAALNELLRGLGDPEDLESLLGTGFDGAKLGELFGEEPDPDKEWEGMPEFDHEDKTSFRKIIVHFKNHEDATTFGELVGQPVTEKTRSLWFPPDEIGHIAEIQYADEEEDDGEE